MKVVDLKQLIKDSGLNERGLLSKLKRKQDLIDFLAAESSSPPPEAPSRAAVVEPPPPPVPAAAQQQQPQQPPQEQQQTPVRKKTRMTMPKKKPSLAGEQQQQQHQQPAKDGRKEQPSPIEILFEQVNEQYPTLQYMVEGNNTLLGELDIRQRYHPMLQAGTQQAVSETDEPQQQQQQNAEDGSDTNNEPGKRLMKPALSGDMDLIFVGTASCTPSITRGVSCTALRLHSLAPSSSSGNNNNNSKKKQNKNVKIDATNTKGGPQRFDVASSSSSSNLGTWLFDCGESTQVRIASYRIQSIHSSRQSTNHQFASFKPCLC